MKHLSFRLNYFILTLVLFAIETGIALYINDFIIRPFVGDVLVVVLIYCFFSTFLNFRFTKIALGVLLFAYCIEFVQYIDIVSKLGIEKNKILSTAIGRTFDWMDIFAYTIGILMVYFVESKRAIHR